MSITTAELVVAPLPLLWGPPTHSSAPRRTTPRRAEQIQAETGPPGGEKSRGIFSEVRGRRVSVPLAAEGLPARRGRLREPRRGGKGGQLSFAGDFLFLPFPGLGGGGSERVGCARPD